MFSVIYNGENDPRNLAADILPARLKEIKRKDNNIMFLDADLMGCSGVSKWAKEDPEHVINCGIAEANMIGIAAGLSSSGFKPFVHSFAPFATRRCFDQLMLSGAYAGNSLTVIGSDPGVLAAFNGATHMSFEDIGLMRLIPGSTVLSVSDASLFSYILDPIKEIPGVKYIGMPRKQLKAIYSSDSTFIIGKANVLKDGSDIAIVAHGITVADALDAARELESRGINATVIDMFTIKPLDTELISYYATKIQYIITAECHNIIGGLYSAVCEAVHGTCNVMPVAVSDRFGEVGPVDYLKDVLGVNAETIVDTAIEVLH